MFICGEQGSARLSIPGDFPISAIPGQKLQAHASVSDFHMDRVLGDQIHHKHFSNFIISLTLKDVLSKKKKKLSLELFCTMRHAYFQQFCHSIA